MKLFITLDLIDDEQACTTLSGISVENVLPLDGITAENATKTAENAIEIVIFD